MNSKVEVEEGSGTYKMADRVRENSYRNDLPGQLREEGVVVRAEEAVVAGDLREYQN
jgi:hypothetical protein